MKSREMTVYRARGNGKGYADGQHGTVHADRGNVRRSIH